VSTASSTTTKQQHLHQRPGPVAYALHWIGRVAALGTASVQTVGAHALRDVLGLPIGDSLEAVSHGNVSN
jgi:hypothetical protein